MSLARDVGRNQRSRKRQNKLSSMTSGDANRLKYSSLGVSLSTTASGNVWDFYRLYVPGESSGLTATVGPTIASYYSTGKFLPGTMTEWIPSVGFTTSGRVFVGFTDNPEVMVNIIALVGTSAYGAAVKGLGDVISFPIYENRSWMVPTKLRRKMFDVNASGPYDANVLDRSAQIAMFVAIEGGPASTTVGGVRCVDNLLVEGIQSTAS
nr:structural protein [Tolivirales sp.]